MHQKPTIHTKLKALYDSKPVIAAQIGLPLLVALGANYLTGASMYQGIASGIAIAAISGIDPRGCKSKKWFGDHEEMQCIFINPLRHALTSAIFYSAIQNAGLSHHSTMLLAKCCSTALFSSHNTSDYVNDTNQMNFTYISFSNIACEALTSYVIENTLGENHYFTQFMANVVARSLAVAGVSHYLDPNRKDKAIHNFSCFMLLALPTSIFDSITPITGTSPIVNLIPESVSTFVSSVVESVSESVAAAVGL